MGHFVVQSVAHYHVNGILHPSRLEHDEMECSIAKRERQVADSPSGAPVIFVIVDEPRHFLAAEASAASRHVRHSRNFEESSYSHRQILHRSVRLKEYQLRKCAPNVETEPST